MKQTKLLPFVAQDGTSFETENERDYYNFECRVQQMDENLQHLVISGANFEPINSANDEHYSNSYYAWYYIRSRTDYQYLIEQYAAVFGECTYVDQPQSFPEYVCINDRCDVFTATGYISRIQKNLELLGCDKIVILLSPEDYYNPETYWSA